MADIDPNAPVISEEVQPVDTAAMQAPVEGSSPTEPQEPSAPVDIPEGWVSLHWKQIVALAKKIAGDVEVTLEDAKRIISDEIMTRSVVDGADGLVAMSKNGDVLHVHPSTVEAHKRAGWTL